MAKRIQRKRTKGWRMPENTIYVGRPTKWGNPFLLSEYGNLALAHYRDRVKGLVLHGALSLRDLSGKDLACWCPIGSPCHADVLLEMVDS